MLHTERTVKRYKVDRNRIVLHERGFLALAKHISGSQPELEDLRLYTEYELGKSSVTLHEWACTEKNCYKASTSTPIESSAAGRRENEAESVLRKVDFAQQTENAT